jgi:hypothetical protein
MSQGTPTNGEEMEKNAAIAALEQLIAEAEELERVKKSLAIRDQYIQQIAARMGIASDDLVETVRGIDDWLKARGV